MGSPLYHDIEGGPPMYKRTYLIFSMLRLWNSLMLIFYIYKMIFLLFYWAIIRQKQYICIILKLRKIQNITFLHILFSTFLPKILLIFSLSL
ncbi:hypothetical protein ACA29_16730 [Lederbergia galactosidilytica]|uniref:Uncharacterized protein n=1 Tax=Lederbergia galactosidilytica TaxID=217031 RepID=A0A0Q9Y7W7_9BACI|nr:hypothetical protein ACA29_16730 [Lederbergia galactosidilytica]